MGLREYITHETVADLPLRQPLTIRPDATVLQAIQMMREKQFGCVFVVDDQNRPLGKFNERQVLKLVHGCVSLDEPVGDHIVPLPEEGVVRLTDPVAQALFGMRQARLRFICVVDDEGKVIGLTGQKGLMEYVTEHFPRQVKVQMMTSKLHMNTREGA
jgi:CBS domain-containing protein